MALSSISSTASIATSVAPATPASDRPKTVGAETEYEQAAGKGTETKVDARAKSTGAEPNARPTALDATPSNDSRVPTPTAKTQPIVALDETLGADLATGFSDEAFLEGKGSSESTTSELPALGAPIQISVSLMAETFAALNMAPIDADLLSAGAADHFVPSSGVSTPDGKSIHMGAGSFASSDVRTDAEFAIQLPLGVAFAQPAADVRTDMDLAALTVGPDGDPTMVEQAPADLWIDPKTGVPTNLAAADTHDWKIDVPSLSTAADVRTDGDHAAPTSGLASDTNLELAQDGSISASTEAIDTHVWKKPVDSQISFSGSAADLSIDPKANAVPTAVPTAYDTMEPAGLAADLQTAFDEMPIQISNVPAQDVATANLDENLAADVALPNVKSAPNQSMDPDNGVAQSAADVRGVDAKASGDSADLGNQGADTMDWGLASAEEGVSATPLDTMEWESDSAPLGTDTADVAPPHTGNPKTEPNLPGATNGDKNVAHLDRRAASAILSQVADRLEALAASRPKQGITIHLKPFDLGTITLNVRGTGRTVEAEVHVSHEAVRQALEQAQKHLSASLESKGLQLSTLRILETAAADTNANFAQQGQTNAQGNRSQSTSPNHRPNFVQANGIEAAKPRATGRLSSTGVDYRI